MFYQTPIQLVVVFMLILGACTNAESTNNEEKGEDSLQGGSGDLTQLDNADSKDNLDSSNTQEGQIIDTFEPFDIAIGQSVTIGAFVLDLDSASVLPGERHIGAFSGNVVGPFAEIHIDFVAHNSSQDLSTPLEDVNDDGLLFEAGGEFFYGVATSDGVPGLRDGVGTLSWVIEDELNLEVIRNGILTFGYAYQNQAIVPLADPAATVSLEDIELETQFSIEGYVSTTIDVTSMRVQYNSRSWNAPLDAGTAWLVVDSVFSADPDMWIGGETWFENNVYLTRPDGVSVPPNRLITAIYPGYREDHTLIFDLALPVAGTYTFGVVKDDNPPVEHQIVIP